MTAAAASTRVLHQRWYDLLSEAYEAGERAATGAVPTPMVVGTPRNMAASLLGGDDGGFDESQPVYFVSEGACGFAWVKFSGNRKFLNYLLGRVKTEVPVGPALRQYGESWRETSVLNPPSPDHYYGGVSLWVGGYGQSVARKEAFAEAFAAVLRDKVEGLTVYGQSRLD